MFNKQKNRCLDLKDNVNRDFYLHSTTECALRNLRERDCHLLPPSGPDLINATNQINFVIYTCYGGSGPIIFNIYAFYLPFWKHLWDSFHKLPHNAISFAPWKLEEVITMTRRECGRMENRILNRWKMKVWTLEAWRVGGLCKFVWTWHLVWWMGTMERTHESSVAKIVMIVTREN